MLLDKSEAASVVYHDIFDYPLNLAELIKWKSGLDIDYKLPQIEKKDDYYFVKGRRGLIYKRLSRKRISDKKLKIAKKASKILRIIPTVKMIAVTGSLAMENASKNSDIDLLIVTSKGALWTTRALVYFLVIVFGIKIRRTFNKNEKDKLCLNMWMDESDLIWPRRDRNIYTAHEIGQIVPLVNKKRIFETFLYKNRWILKHWPSCVKIFTKRGPSKEKVFSFINLFLIPFEIVFYWLQHNYMKSKMTREVVTGTRAIFHPNDWGKVVLDRLKEGFVE